MKIIHRYEISKDLNKYLMSKKIILFFAISSWFAPSETNLNLFIQFLLKYKILNQNAIFLYNRHTVNFQIDEINKIRSISCSFIIIFVCYIEKMFSPAERHLFLIQVHSLYNIGIFVNAQTIDFRHFSHIKFSVLN